MQRYQDSLVILLVAEKEADSLISDINAAIDKHNELGKALIVDPETSSNSSKPQNKGKGRETSSVDDDGLPHTAAAEEHRNKLRAMQARLRECQIAMHRVKFILGDVYHMLGNERLESDAYGAAEELRRVLLRSKLPRVFSVSPRLTALFRHRRGGEPCHEPTQDRYK